MIGSSSTTLPILRTEEEHHGKTEKYSEQAAQPAGRPEHDGHGVLTTYQVIVRYIFNSPSTWSEELVGYLFGWSTMLGATIVSGERGHMNIPVLIDRFNPTMRKAFHIFAEVIAFIFSAAILVFGGFQVSKLAMGQQTSSLGVAVGVFYRVMPVCGVIILVYSVLNIIGIANGSICLDVPEDADFAKVEAEMAADADKENKED